VCHPRSSVPRRRATSRGGSGLSPRVCHLGGSPPRHRVACLIHQVDLFAAFYLIIRRYALYGTFPFVSRHFDSLLASRGGSGVSTGECRQANKIPRHRGACCFYLFDILEFSGASYFID